MRLVRYLVDANYPGESRSRRPARISGAGSLPNESGESTAARPILLGEQQTAAAGSAGGTTTWRRRGEAGKSLSRASGYGAGKRHCRGCPARPAGFRNRTRKAESVAGRGVRSRNDCDGRSGFDISGARAGTGGKGTRAAIGRGGGECISAAQRIAGRTERRVDCGSRSPQHSDGRGFRRESGRDTPQGLHARTRLQDGVGRQFSVTGVRAIPNTREFARTNARSLRPGGFTDALTITGWRARGFRRP